MMMKHKFLFIAAMAVCGSSSQAGAQRLTDAVDPFIGSGGHGHVFVGASLPFGGITVGPTQVESGWDWCSGYHWSGKYVRGFAPMHLSGTGCPDLADILLMPVTGSVDMTVGDTTKRTSGFYSTYSHQRESCRPGYYEVLLDRYGIRARMTATKRVAYEEYHYPVGSDARVVVDVENGIGWNVPTSCELRQLDDTTLVGHRFSRGWASDRRHYFVIRFSRPMKSWTTAPSQAKAENGGPAFPVGYGAAAFDVTADTVVGVRMALSSVSLAGAMANLDNESAGRSFEQVKTSADSVWNAALSRVEATFDSEREHRIFYTALYHTMIHPTLYGDTDGSYRGSDGKNHRSDGFDNYTVFSLWDTYRAEHPLLTFMHPTRVGDMVKSFLDHYEQFGRLPVWNFYSNETDMMIGYHSVPVIVDAYLKGIGDFDAAAALDACIATAKRDDYRGIGFYRQHGYVPAYTDPAKWENWSLSKTLEYAYDDWCIAVMADSLGRDDVAREFYARAGNYRNVYNPATTFMQPKNERGEFVTPFNPDDYTEDICESNAWHYFWSVQHDIDGLIALAGGAERFGAKLDSLFTYAPGEDDELPIFSTGMIGQYAHGNEPSHHVAYLYNYIGQPWKAQMRLGEIMHGLYRNAPHGLCGNEDCGQMSAWYVLSAMGFYPVNPVGGVYDLGTPMFPKVEMRLPGGKTFTILAEGVSPENVYVQSVKLDGKPLDRLTITHDMIVSGGTLQFVMGPAPLK